ncbi:Por secretion system C-terminal sorting domain-containing protein [Lutibacter agarilyticus]|uniref:Por secretion system C-terminal sorting domain-containing protein n=1 Tax=Lutibacter agarilyticus TaxID=1109740 RepID=A0A238Z4N0_9FLAO|nr:T9SS type A sorting domain-containing protein [Lutibacter agarilyticus]SNR78296.1 Por secretion system C-terminal sorting domain-containing protein [Lutibacter agarilyticus]
MKKITLLAALLVAFITNAQKVYDFTGSQNPGSWAKQGGGGLLDNPNGVVTSAEGLVLEFRNSGLIYLTTTDPAEAAYVSKPGDLMRITLINNNTEVDVLGPLNDRNDATGGIQFYAVNNDLVPAATVGAGIEQVVTVALTANYKNDNGDGTLNDTDGVENMERVGLRMGATIGMVGSNPFLTQTSADAGNIIIKKIEILSAGTSVKNNYNFASDDITGFTSTSSASGSVADGGNTINYSTGTSGAQYPKLAQTFFAVNASANQYVHIVVEDNTTDANEIRFQLINPAGGVFSYNNDIGVLNNGAPTLLELDLTTIPEWTGNYVGWNIMFTKGGAAVSDGVIKIASIVFDNDSGTLGTNDYAFNNVAVYPNPTSGILNIEGVNDISSVKLFDITGRKILETSNLSNNQLDISILNSGVYILSIEDSNKNVLVKRFVKE